MTEFDDFAEWRCGGNTYPDLKNAAGVHLPHPGRTQGFALPIPAGLLDIKVMAVRRIDSLIPASQKVQNWIPDRVYYRGVHCPILIIPAGYLRYCPQEPRLILPKNEKYTSTAGTESVDNVSDDVSSRAE